MEEFIRFIKKEMHENNDKEELLEAFRKFTGTDEMSQGITKEQLKATMETYGERRLTPEEFAMLFEETDHDNDGLINFEDFVRMMMSR